MKITLVRTQIRMVLYLTFQVPGMLALISLITLIYSGAFLRYKVLGKPEGHAIDDAADTCQDLTLTYHENAELINAIIWFCTLITLIF